MKTGPEGRPRRRIEKYNQLHGVTKVDGMGTFEEVFARTSAVIEDSFKNMR